MNIALHLETTNKVLVPASTLRRYVPSGPGQSGADEWASWWKASQPYLFASDAGDYCWYIDPLAKKRGVPSTELRGPKRADPTATVAMK